MDIRIFQIIVPVIMLAFIGWRIIKVYQTKAEWKDIWPSILISLVIGIIALYPDRITRKLARILDFESNINALFFVLIGVLFLSLFRLYDLYRRQQKSITKLTIELSLLKAEKEIPA